MANYPQLDNASGVWNLREVYDAVMGGYWPNANNRAIVAGGFTPSYTSVISDFNMASSGTTTSFGSLDIARGEFGAMSNFTRCVFAGGNEEPGGTNSNTLDYVQFATKGNTANFGTIGAASQRTQGVGGNATRGVFTEGTSDTNQIQYITINSLGNAVDFGDRTVSGSYAAGVTSPTRTCFGGAFTPSTSNIIDFIEIATTGNAVDFGDLSNSIRDAGGCSSSTRGVFMAGITPSYLNVLDLITIASQGNAIDYGDLTYSARGNTGVSNSVSGFSCGGDASPAVVETINKFVIATGGTATDFGDLIQPAKNTASNSAAHGGLNDGYQGTRPLPFNEAGGDVGMFAGGSPDLELIQTINISSTGNAQKFGDLTTGRRQFAGGFSNKTRSLSANGYDGGSPGYPAIIEYVEFATQGNSANFGNTISASEAGSALANNTRGMYTLGVAVPAGVSNSIEYVTISTLGNAADFGNLSVARHNAAGLSSNTRGINGGGATPSLSDVIDYVTISTTGDATDFGNLSVARASAAGANSTTRGVFGGGASPTTSANINTIDYITIATTGNASDFGDLVTARRGLHGSVASNTIKGTFAGGQTPSNTDEIDQITIASTANATDFGDLMVSTNNVAASSNGHGGLVGG